MASEELESPSPYTRTHAHTHTHTYHRHHHHRLIFSICMSSSTLHSESCVFYVYYHHGTEKACLRVHVRSIYLCVCRLEFNVKLNNDICMTIRTTWIPADQRRVPKANEHRPYVLDVSMYPMSVHLGLNVPVCISVSLVHVCIARITYCVPYMFSNSHFMYPYFPYFFNGKITRLPSPLSHTYSGVAKNSCEDVRQGASGNRTAATWLVQDDVSGLTLNPEH